MTNTHAINDDVNLDLIIEQQSRLAKVMGNPDRLQILRLLRTSREAGNEDMGAAEIGRKLGLAKANLSRHISKMRAVGLVKTRRDGAYLFVREAHAEIGRLCDMMRDLIRADLVERSGMLDCLSQSEQSDRGAALGGAVIDPATHQKFGMGGA